MKTIKVASIVVAPLLITSLFLIGVTASEYDPWYDFDDDGDIDIFDIVDIAARYGTTGTPINKTALLLELQTKIDELNATIASLESRVSALEGQAIVQICAENSHYTTQIWTPPPASLNPNDIKVDFPVIFTNPSNVELSASGVVTTGSCAGAPFRVTGMQIETDYAVLSLQGWNGASWTNLGAGDEVDISYVALEK